MAKRLNLLRSLSGDKKAKDTHLLLAQLVADGFDIEEVLPYLVATPTAKQRKSVDILINSLKEIVPYFDRLVQTIKGDTYAPDQNSTPIEDDLDTSSKESVIAHLKAEYREATDVKQRSDILMKIADLQKMKQDEIKDEHRQVMFYLPMSNCNACPCFEEAKKNHPDLELVDNRPVKLK